MSYQQFYNHSFEEGDPHGEHTKLENQEYYRQRQARKWRHCYRLLFGITFTVCVIIVTSLCIVESGRGIARSKARGKLPPLVNTSAGLVQGTLLNGVAVFKGIPYGKVAETSRWQAAEPVESWEGTLLANNYGPKCLQQNDAGHLEGTEDCLRLNVWAPGSALSWKHARRHVVVYLHDGGLLRGSGHEVGLTPTTQLAKETDTVYVSLNYRLGVFGWLTLEALSWSAPGGTSGNYGLMDQLEALRWVQKHIDKFGGDPSHVTLFGLGAGGGAAMALLQSPEARGLFSRVWAADPMPVEPTPRVQAEQDNLKFLLSTGCLRANSSRSARTVRCLRLMKHSHLVSAFSQAGAHGVSSLSLQSQGRAALITRDGHVIPDVVRRHAVVKVPLLVGLSPQQRGYEGRLPENEAALHDLLTQAFPRAQEDAVNTLLDTYKHGGALTAAQQLRDMVFDLRVTCPLRRALAGRGAAATLYVSGPDTPAGRAQPGYQTPVMTFFGNWEAVVSPTDAAAARRYRQYGEALRALLRRFADTGRAGPDSVLPNAVLLSRTGQGHVTGAYKRDECRMWRGVIRSL